jgi:hypothetical protein
MTIERDAYRFPIYEFIDSLVKREIMGPEQVVDEGHVRHPTGVVNLPAINCPHFDNPIRIAEGERQRRTIEINNHPGDGGIDISGNAVFKTEHNTGIGITVITEFVLFKKQKRADDFRDLSSTVRNGYQERIAFFHHLK